LAERFQRRKLKCEKLKDDGQVMAKNRGLTVPYDNLSICVFDFICRVLYLPEVIGTVVGS
jgi:hypothetical protein